MFSERFIISLFLYSCKRVNERKAHETSRAVYERVHGCSYTGHPNQCEMRRWCGLDWCLLKRRQKWVLRFQGRTHTDWDYSNICLPACLSVWLAGPPMTVGGLLIHSGWWAATVIGGRMWRKDRRPEPNEEAPGWAQAQGYDTGCMQRLLPGQNWDVLLDSVKLHKLPNLSSAAWPQSCERGHKVAAHCE